MVKIVHQHQDFYIVTKPADVGFHDEQDGQTGFFNVCCHQLKETLYPVHRLDKITSGLLILARNKAAAVWFQQAFEQRTIEKLYLALADSKPKKKQGSIIGDMVKSRNSQWKLLSSKQNPAISRFFSWGIPDAAGTGLRLFLIKPESGKTHQIRVALKSLGSPILGDPLYSSTTSDRGYLHAFGLRFNYKGDELEIYEQPEQGSTFLQHQEYIASTVEQGFAKSWPNGK